MQAVLEGQTVPRKTLDDRVKGRVQHGHIRSALGSNTASCNFISFVHANRPDNGDNTW